MLYKISRAMKWDDPAAGNPLKAPMQLRYKIVQTILYIIGTDKKTDYTRKKEHKYHI